MTFGIKVEAAFGADLAASPGTWTWTDISAYVLGRNGNKATITRGRQDESSQAQPATVTFELDNSDGRFTPDHPLSPYYPNVTLNLPLRVSIDPGSGFVSRGVLYASSYAPSWDESVTFPTIVVVASGVLRRLGLGNKPLRSPLTRAILLRKPFASWSLEDASGATQAAANPGIALQASGSVTFGAVGPAGAASAVDFTAGGIMQAGIATALSSPSWRAVFAIKLTSTAAAVTPIKWMTSTGVEWSLTLNPVTGGFTITTFDGIATTAFSSITPTIADTTWHMVQVNAVQNSGVDVSIAIDGSAWVTQSGFLGAGTILGSPTSVTIGSISHNFFMSALGFMSPTTTNPEAASLLYAALGGHLGELASDRIARLCADAHIPTTATGTSTTAMGVQPSATLLNLLRACEIADSGILYETLDGGLGYLSLSARYNLAASMTVDNGLGQLPVGFAPVKDDQLIVNDVVASRDQGSSAEYQDQDSVDTVGLYDIPVTLSVRDDSTLPDQASWRAHLGLVGGLRYPQLSVDLVASPELIAAWVGCDIGRRMTVKNLPPQHPPGDIDLILQGYTETIDALTWRVAGNCSPYDPYRVGVYDQSKADSSSSILVAAASSGATSLTVGTVLEGDLWTTDPSDFPFDIKVDGEQMAVSAIAPLVSDSFGRTSTDSWGSPDVGPAWIATGGTGTDYDVTPGSGTILHPSVNVGHNVTLTVGLRDFDAVVDFKTATGVFATGGPILVSLATAWADASNSYQFRAQLETSGAVTALVIRRSGGSETVLASATVPGLSWSSNSFHSIRAHMAGSTLQVKVWHASDAEPDGWHATGVDTLTLLSAGRVGVATNRAAGNSNSNLLLTFDNFAVVNPQTFTVTRGVNGVAKAQAVGAEVHLHQPAIAAL